MGWGVGGREGGLVACLAWCEVLWRVMGMRWEFFLIGFWSVLLVEADWELTVKREEYARRRGRSITHFVLLQRELLAYFGRDR
jgi:hypothetical protein